MNAVRDNVIFEHGLFTGILGRKKAIVIKSGDVKIPSNLHGLMCIDYKENPEFAELNIKSWVESTKELLAIKSNDDNIKNKELTQAKETKHQPEKILELASVHKGIYYRLIDGKEIMISEPLSISKKLITQEDYHSVMDNNPSHFKGNLLPVENVTFRDAITFCNELSKKKGYQNVYTIINDEIQWDKKMKGYRLPFEIEWEYVLAHNIKEIQVHLDKLAWYSRNSDRKTHNVGLKRENRHGLYDLLGNVWEWCFDSYNKTPPQTAVFENNNEYRVVRGGSFADFRTMFQEEEKFFFRRKQYEFEKNRFTRFRIVLQNANMEV